MSHFDIKSKKNVLTVGAVVVTAAVVGLIVTDHSARERNAAQTSLAAANATEAADDGTGSASLTSASKAPNPLLAPPTNSKISPGILASGATNGVNSDGISTLQGPPPANGSDTSSS